MSERKRGGKKQGGRREGTKAQGKREAAAIAVTQTRPRPEASVDTAAHFLH